MKSKHKVRRVEMEKVKSGKGGHLHKVTVHHHEAPPKEGKGMKGAMTSSWQPPEETYHTSAASAKRHMHSAMSRMTATPEEAMDAGGPEEMGENE